MKTSNKIAVARTMYRVLRTGRKMVGRTDRATVIRGGAMYDLDLSQGIDFAIYLGAYEPGTSARLRKLVKPGMLALDIGANIGAHTLTLAQLVGPSGKVICFEPTSFAVQKLRRNLALNPSLASRVEVHQCYLTEHDAVQIPGAIYSRWSLEPEQGQHGKHLGTLMGTGAAKARSLDSILAECADRPVGLVKMDVDGYECDVLSGATALLKGAQPIFVMEIAPYVLQERGTTLNHLLSYFEPNGYRLFSERTMRPISSQQIRDMTVDGASVNVVAVPQKAH